jgi:hypothetical protein
MDQEELSLLAGGLTGPRSLEPSELADAQAVALQRSTCPDMASRKLTIEASNLHKL